MKLRSIMPFILLFCQLSYGQKLIALFEEEESFLDSIDRTLVIPKYDLKEYINGEIFHKNVRIFKPENEFEFSIYQIYGDRFLIISALNNKSIASNLRYRLPKNKIIIFDLKNGKEVYKGDIKGKYLYDIYYDKDDFLILELSSAITRIIIE